MQYLELWQPAGDDEGGRVKNGQSLVKTSVSRASRFFIYK